MAGRDILLTGLPRSGTTLACHLLNKVPDTVALHEPMRVERFAAMPSRAAICAAIAEFAREQRATLRASGCAITKHIDGLVPDNPVARTPDAAGLRGSAAELGSARFPQALSPDATLVIKHPSAFTALLPELAARFPVFAVTRNPISVIGSWTSVRFAHREGHAPAAEQLAPELRERLARLPDRVDRQIVLLSWFFEQYRRHLPPSHIVRYETLISTGGGALGAIVPAASALRESLTNHNRNPFYDLRTLQAVGERLLRSDGAQWHFYDRADVEALLR